MSFIVLEGLDGSGKSTQVKLIREYFDNKNIKYKYLHFPQTNSPVFGELVSMFLRGDLGENNMVSPYLVALIYAGDRDNAKAMIQDWLNEDYLILIDRYIYSNIAFQCAKINDFNEKEKLKNWIINLEYKFYKIPKPNISIYLDVPFDFTKNNLSNVRDGYDRDYLKGKTDIHEKDIDFQEKVRQEYLKIFSSEKDCKIIECYSPNNSMLKPDEVFNKISNLLRTYKLIN
ncbi:MAG: dTMP kinase [Bacteroidetes bacterium GWA2_30_7]|nr:MAG: dTMP kinase [Bacteroidetes bacterium GWA2_30_7]